MTTEECDKSYSDEAVQIGHKIFLIEKMKADVRHLEFEIESHTKKCFWLNEEKIRLLTAQKKEQNV